MDPHALQQLQQAAEAGDPQAQALLMQMQGASSDGNSAYDDGFARFLDGANGVGAMAAGAITNQEANRTRGLATHAALAPNAAQDPAGAPMPDPGGPFTMDNFDPSQQQGVPQGEPPMPINMSDPRLMELLMKVSRGGQ